MLPTSSYTTAFFFLRIDAENHRDRHFKIRALSLSTDIASVNLQFLVFKFSQLHHTPNFISLPFLLKSDTAAHWFRSFVSARPSLIRISPAQIKPKPFCLATRTSDVAWSPTCLCLWVAPARCKPFPAQIPIPVFSNW
jgi:hypothetical protein